MEKKIYRCSNVSFYTFTVRYEFPQDVYTDRSLLTNLVTEHYRSDCSDSFAYITDPDDNGLIVFDYARLESWRIQNKYLYPFPEGGTISIAGVTYDVMSGIFGLTLGKHFVMHPLLSVIHAYIHVLGPYTEYDRKLYFHSASGFRESWVSTSVLRNKTLAQDPIVARTAFVLSPGERLGQSTVEVMTDDGVLIYSLSPQTAIACWNSRKPFTNENQHILEMVSMRTPSITPYGVSDIWSKRYHRI